MPIFHKISPESGVRGLGDHRGC
ncbi:uncharacterized protein G2W53_015795 [Senna tora]|uniref:Uncharacterized protein n=1 Tax=Senna tora TaxID=362788 RepID=A0A835CAQ1_9FABA|nr:uncharacterized protein G2W53_015795 [Senna tora]